mmetsp:Transcript_89222/g.186468  ORF Transcript_89222/g.186468 Transcript_89222/m.186468 type:complete len:484 (-) Transcript_89222:14-1465(-)
MDSKQLPIAVASVAAAVVAAVATTVIILEHREKNGRPMTEAPSGPKKDKSSSLEDQRFDGSTADNRSRNAAIVSRWTRPVVIASPGLEDLAKTLRKRLGCEEYSPEEGPTLSLENFKSNDPNIKFNWQRLVGRRVVFLFDTVDQSRLFEQLCILQALQGFAVPDGDDKHSKWKTYVDQGKYSWGRVAHITVVLPWYRPCQMERTSRWSFTPEGKWTNDSPKGEWLDCPTAQYYARLLSTPGSVPPLPGPYEALDGMPLNPLWRPPLELLFVELHEERPVSHSVSDLGATIRMERFVPYFLDKHKSKRDYAGSGSTYVLFPDKGAYVRYVSSVVNVLKLDADHILYIKKTRVGETIGQEQKLFYDLGNGNSGEKSSFKMGDSVVIIDDFTNSGSTLFGAVSLAQKMSDDNGKGLKVTIFVSHLVATYDPKVVEGIKGKLEGLGPQTRFVTTNTIPVTTDILKGHPQADVLDVSDFIADLVVTAR